MYMYVCMNVQKQGIIPARISDKQRVNINDDKTLIRGITIILLQNCYKDLHNIKYAHLNYFLFTAIFTKCVSYCL